MSGVWVIVILIALMIMFLFAIQTIAKQQGKIILTKKDILKAKKDMNNHVSKG